MRDEPKLWIPLLLVLLLTKLPCSIQAQGPPTSRPTDRSELEALLDPIFSDQMEKLHIAGAVFVLVKNGEIFFAKGYGYANLEKRTPVVPDKTLFRVASVSKLFTATAVMQLAERGLLTLDDDVNKHLKLFHLENNYPKPVTFANLLTHTAGFDDRYIAFAALSSSPPEPLGEYLAKRMPPRVMPPGKFISYSNHGYALLGYLVEGISGIPYAQYIDENILKPLDMTHSSFRLTATLAPDLAVGYRYENGNYLPVPFDYVKTAPASQLISTATDMAHFMIAHLQNGRYGNSRILNEATAQEMHRQHFTQHPNLPGWCYGFEEQFEKNRRAIVHGGSWGSFGSLLFLLPESNIGFFLSYNNNASQPELEDEVVRQFLDHYYPVQKKLAATQPLADFQKRAKLYTGIYQVDRYSRRSIEKLRLLRGGQVRVTANENGTLIVGSDHYVEVQPLLFRKVDEERYIAFHQDENGNVTHLFMAPGLYARVYDRLAWYETPAFHLKLIIFFALVFLSACIGWPIGYLIRREQKLPSEATRLSRRARLLAGLVSALNLVFMIGLALVTWDSTLQIWYGLPPMVRGLLLIPLLTTVLTVGLLLYVVLAWKNRYWSTLGRLHYSFVTLAAVSFIPFLLYWNLLGFKY